MIGIPFLRFLATEKTLAGGKICFEKEREGEKKCVLSLLCTSRHRKVTAAGIYYARTYAREKLEI